MKALETRVAELETLLANAGLTDSGRDHWASVWHGEALTEADSNPPVSADRQTARWMPNSGSKRQQGTHNEPASTSEYLKNLSLEAGGGFVGEESSNITLGHMLKAVVQGRQSTMAAPDQQDAPLSPKSLFSASGNELQDMVPRVNELVRMSDDIAETLIKAYQKHLSTRWVVLYRPQLLYLHKKRKELIDPFDISTLNMVYATAGRFLETTGVTGNFFPDRHYNAALAHLDGLLRSHDIRSVQTLLLHAVYCLRAPRGLSAWTHVGLAIRISIELGLHRRTRSERPCLASEIRKRIFWSCYCLDRQVSIILGRPFAISDRDIDVEVKQMLESKSLINVLTDPASTRC